MLHNEKQNNNYFVYLPYIIYINLYLFKLIKKILKKPKWSKIEEETSYNSNIILDVYYSSTDMKGNEYIIYAQKGEIDFKNSNIVYLTNVNAYKT